MLTKEEFETLISSIKERLDETTGALVSEDLLSVISNYALAVEEITTLGEEIGKLKADNEELLKVNGRLFQKIGFDKEEEKEEEIEDAVEEMAIEDLIDEKGEFKDE